MPTVAPHWPSCQFLSNQCKREIHAKCKQTLKSFFKIDILQGSLREVMSD